MLMISINNIPKQSSIYKTMYKKSQQYSQSQSFITHKNSITTKISLKKIKPTIITPQITQKSTTCQSIHISTNKQSIKNLLQVAKCRNHHSQIYISMTYDDIRVCLQSKSTYFITTLLCAINPPLQQIGCNCGQGVRCKWMEHWLALSMKSIPYQVQKINLVPKIIQDQIIKDIKRAQPFSKTFQSQQYQSVLYQCLMAYAKIDPEVGYVQGMNIICSVLVYHNHNHNHNLNIYECIQVLRYLMINCQFRKVYLSDFQFAHKLANNLIQALKYRCADLHRHLINNNSVNLQIFIIGWILPMLGNIIPLGQMHMVVNCFIQKGWQGMIKILISLLLYLRPTILGLSQQTELMEIFSVHCLINRSLPWEEIVISASNVKITSYLNQ